MVTDAGGEADASAPPPPHLRQGPGAFAWISLALLLISLGMLLYAFVVGAHGGALVSVLAAAFLVIPTVILTAVWIEVHTDNRRAKRQYEDAVARRTQSH